MVRPLIAVHLRYQLHTHAFLPRARKRDPLLLSARKNFVGKWKLAKRSKSGNTVSPALCQRIHLDFHLACERANKDQ